MAPLGFKHMVALQAPPASPPNVRAAGGCYLATSGASKEWYQFPGKMWSGHPPLACMDYYHPLVSTFVITRNSSHLSVFVGLAEVPASKLGM